MPDLFAPLQAALGSAYRLDKELGGGGMSRVFVAEETRLARRVVVKVLPPDLALEMRVDRFNREIQLSASLQHPHIVPLLSAGGMDDLLYYTMPFVEGEALRTRLTRDGELPVRDAIRILKDVADALAYAHARGVVHRDIKPDNVLLSGNHAVVADFGVAKAVSHAKTESTLTSVGVALGTPAYMAPEQAAGDPDVDARADIYAFGAMAYEMLTGRPPFAGLPPHQLLAAHMSKPVVPITDHRPAIRPALAELVMACLAKDPTDRPQSAEAILQALETIGAQSDRRMGTSPAAPLRVALRRPRNMMLASAVLVSIIAAAGWRVLRPGTTATLDGNRVAIAPFDVLGGAELSLWREGLVDILSRSLDGAGPLRTVSPTLVVRRWSGRSDAQSAQTLGQQTGARTVVFGSVVRAGADSVRLTAAVLDVHGPSVLGEIELRERSDRIDRLADSLTVRVLRELGRTRAIGLVRSASLGSRSLPALKAFLQGEQFMRRSEWDSSLAYHQRAIALDSGFTLAWSRAGMAAGWQHTAADSLSRTYKKRAGAMNHGLAPRESLIVQAESLAAAVYEGPVQLGGRWWTYGKRLIATLDEAVRQYPNDPELWYMAGDARHHAGAMARVPARASLEAFDRAIALDSALTPSYVHAISLGLEYGGAEAGRRYADAFLAAGAMGTYAQSTRLIIQLTDPTTRSHAIRYLADSGSAQLFQTVWMAIGRWTDSAETMVELVRGRAEAEQKRGASSLNIYALPIALSARGHVKEAARHTTYPELVSQLAILGAFSSDSTRRLARNWVAHPGGGGLIYSLPLLAGVHDKATLVQARRTIDSARANLPPQVPPIARDILDYLGVTVRAYLALERADTAEAVRLLAARPDTACFSTCTIDDLVNVQLLVARGRLGEAAELLERPIIVYSPGLMPVEVLRAMERGRVNERLGNRERAVEGYSIVVAAWRNPDPELLPFVAEARAALLRLMADKRRPD